MEIVSYTFSAFCFMYSGNISRNGYVIVALLSLQHCIQCLRTDTTMWGIKGSVENNSSEPLITAITELVNVNGAVGWATPNMTSAIREFLVSHNSFTVSLISVWKTFRHFIEGCEAWLVLQVKDKTFPFLIFLCYDITLYNYKISNLT